VLIAALRNSLRALRGSSSLAECPTTTIVRVNFRRAPRVRVDVRSAAPNRHFFFYCFFVAGWDIEGVIRAACLALALSLASAGAWAKSSTRPALAGPRAGFVGKLLSRPAQSSCCRAEQR